MLVDIIAVILGLVGLAGCILPALPGPPVSWCAILLLYLTDATYSSGEPVSATLLFSLLAATVVVSVLDYIIPVKITRVAGGSSHAARGALAGMLAGIIFTPIGMMLGTFLGALFAELHYTDKNLKEALKGAAGTFVGTVLGIGLKLVVSVIIMYYIIRLL